MDHVSVTTTMGYYQVSLKRKQQAIRSVGPLATDAAGNPAPFASPTAYQRASVAVPFGNCTEPSNVKAGGGAWPIRFQCAGCGFYRPDPSYLPALELHVAGLRTGPVAGSGNAWARPRSSLTHLTGRQYPGATPMCGGSCPSTIPQCNSESTQTSAHLGRSAASGCGFESGGGWDAVARSAASCSASSTDAARTTSV